jgi:ubiquitin-protein ligase
MAFVLLKGDRRPMSAYESPRIRRLRSDLAALEKLKAESSVFGFKSTGRPPQQYSVSFQGSSLARDRGKVVVREHHEVEIKLGASYPRTMPEIRWLTPIYHPNISEIGMVCLGAYGTHWVPSLALDELCVMLWDMARYQNYDIRSPYNREAAQWAANQTTFRFPMDHRPLRDARAALGRVEQPGSKGTGDEPLKKFPALGESICILDMEIDLSRASAPSPPRPEPVEEVIFLD